MLLEGMRITMKLFGTTGNVCSNLKSIRPLGQKFYLWDLGLSVLKQNSI